jgi:uncharacterized surface protein with fasciclin (FAS1) repeats
MKTTLQKLVALGVLVSFIAPGVTSSAAASEEKILLAAKTKRFAEKEGFEREAKDVINTLKDNDVTSFNTYLDGLQVAFALDKTLKGKGPFTVLAPNDKAFQRIPAADLQMLWSNKNKLKQVLTYTVLPGRFSSDALRKMTSIKTMEGKEVRLSERKGDLYIDKALVTVTDIPASNGVIHVLDHVIMPQLAE